MSGIGWILAYGRRKDVPFPGQVKGGGRTGRTGARMISDSSGEGHASSVAAGKILRRRVSGREFRQDEDWRVAGRESAAR